MKKILYTLTILIGMALTACQKGEQGLPGKNGTPGITGGTKGSTGAKGAKGATGSLGNIQVIVKDTTINVVANNIGRFVNINSDFYSLDWLELFFKNSDGSYSPLPCDINDKLSLSYYDSSGDVFLRFTNKTNSPQQLSTSLNLRIITYSGISNITLKHQAGGLDYNHLQKYFKLR